MNKARGDVKKFEKFLTVNVKKLVSDGVLASYSIVKPTDNEMILTVKDSEGNEETIRFAK